MRSIRKFSFGVATLLALSSIGTAGALYTFEDIAAGKAVPFSDTVNGLTAAFSSSGAVCDIGILGLSLQSGNALITDFCVPGPVSPISVAFSSPLSSVLMDFATAGSGTLTLTAFLGAAQVGSTSATGTVLTSVPEGVIGFSGAPFDNFTLSAPFAISIDNLNASVVPEPGSVLLAGAAMLGLAAFGWRRAHAPGKPATPPRP